MISRSPSKVGDRIRICIDARTEQGTGNMGEPARLSYGFAVIAKVVGDKVAILDGKNLLWPRSWVRLLS